MSNKTCLNCNKEMKPVKELLEQIAKGVGAYSRDQHEHANNVITESIENAKEALRLLNLED